MRLYLACSGGTTTYGAGGVHEIAYAAQAIERRGLKTYLAMDNRRDAYDIAGAADGQGVTPRILISYHYFKDVDIGERFEAWFGDKMPDVFVDSGAFTVWTKGATIRVEDYVEWIKRWQPLITTYANLDVINDADGTRRNQLKMEDMGLTPLPVYHIREGLDILDWYLERYAYIGLGGGVGIPSGVQSKCYARAFKQAGDKAVFHGFGQTGWQKLVAFPWYSVDSTSWMQGFRYGNVPVFDYRKGKFVRIRLRDAGDVYANADLLRRMGIEPLVLADGEQYDRRPVCMVMAASYMLAERWLRERYGEVLIPERVGA